MEKVHSLFEREFTQINLVLQRSDQINELLYLRLEHCLQEELQNICIIALLAEMLLEEIIYCHLQDERVVYSNLANFGDTVPSGLTLAHNR